MAVVRGTTCLYSRHAYQLLQLVRGSVSVTVTRSHSDCSPLRGLFGGSTRTHCSIVSQRGRRRTCNWPGVAVRDYHRGRAVWKDREGESQGFSAGQSAEEDKKEESREEEEEEEGERILAASLAFVPQHGWSTEAIAEGARSLGLSGTVHGIFPRGGYDIISFFEHQCNEKLASHLKQLSDPQGESKLSGGSIVRDAVEHRLRMIVPFIGQWPQALAIKAHPLHVADSLQTLAFMLDDIWYYAGDRSTDMNWYTKRALLSYVYCSTELFMVQDSSIDFSDTWSFMDRRLADVRTAGLTTQQLVDCGQAALSIASGIYKTAINTLGWRSTTQ